MIFFYARVSTTNQNLGRQLVQAHELNITTENEDLFIDKCTGTNFNRKGFNKLLDILTVRNIDGAKGDILYIAELDRFGRDYIEIKHNIAIIEGLGVELNFLDIPLIQTEDNTTNKLLRDQFINTLSYVAEKETQKRKQRQAEGIAAMPVNEYGKKVSSKTGKEVGRPKVKIPNDFKTVYERVKEGVISNVEARKILGVKKTSYYKYIKILNEEIEVK